MMNVTESAAAAVRKVVSGSAEKAEGLRIMVQSGGCAGVVYRMGLEAAPKDGDHVINIGEDVKVFVDADSQPLLNGTVLDFKESVGGAGFVFENPNATESCSCGKSFSAPGSC
ncbi:HesB/IscA family protein [Rhodospirillum sp. A1_3_36]|uniref:HesB/IscA family protein n=1 Tax=Rhodospirillum sp. A1_3_36 TaxID=3391666 RepID=UPI0039A45675